MSAAAERSDKLMEWLAYCEAHPEQMPWLTHTTDCWYWHPHCAARAMLERCAGIAEAEERRAAQEPELGGVAGALRLVAARMRGAEPEPWWHAPGRRTETKEAR